MRLSAALAVLLALPAAADQLPGEVPTAKPLPVFQEPTPQDLLHEMEGVALAQKHLHPLAARDLEGRLTAYGPRFKALGLRAVPLLCWYIGRSERPLKVRLYAAAFLGLIADPAAFPALKAEAAAPGEDPGLRSAAVQSLGALRLAPHELRPALDALAAAEEPPAVRREALGQLAAVGTERVAQVVAAARSFGSAPRGVDALAAGAAAEALGRSPDSAADRALIGLIAWWRPGAPPRGRALAALAHRRAPGAKRFVPTRREMDGLLKAPFEESGDAALSAARLLGALGDRRAAPALARLLRSATTAALAAEAASALAAVGDPASKEPVAALAAGLSRDRRFGAEAGPDVGLLARTVEDAARRLGTETPGPGAPSTGTFQFQGWPGEGVPHLVAAGPAIVLRASPSSGSAAVDRLEPGGGETLAFARSVVVTRRSGWCRAKAEGTLRGASYGPRASLSKEDQVQPTAWEVPVRLGELIEVLASRGGGACLVRVKGTVARTDCPPSALLEPIEPQLTEWWLELDHRGHKGWVSADDAALTILRD